MMTDTDSIGQTPSSLERYRVFVHFSSKCSNCKRMCVGSLITG